MQLYVKHATLINNCYPENEDKPRSSELSYLVFYCTSKPIKLPKVGSFLEKKVERDTAKGRKQNNLVSLKIVQALIESCHKDLNLFSKYVVKIIDMMLTTKDIEIIDLACQVFIIFTNHHDGTTLGVDEELTKDYESLLNKFAEYCSFEINDEELELQMRFVGHKAIHSAIKSNALIQASNFKAQLDAILLPLINTLSFSKNPTDIFNLSREEIDIQQSVIDYDTISIDFVDILAAKSISILFDKINGSTIKSALHPLFNVLDSQEQWWPTDFAVSMMELVLNSLQPQHRYLLVSELLYQIELLPLCESDDYDIEKHASLVSILDNILNANVPLVGVSVLEVLNSLFTHLIRSIHEFGGFRLEQPSNFDNTTFEYTIQHGLAHCIGGLASQTYYMNQLNDIIGYIFSKLKVNNNASDIIDGLPIDDYRLVTFKCLDLVILASNKQENHHSLTLDIWVPALALLTDKSQESRVNFAITLVHYIESITDENEIGKEPLNQQSDVVLVNTLHQTILDWIQLPNLGVQDVRWIRHILTALVNKFGIDETIKAIPLMFKIQNLVKQLAIKPSARQRALAALVVEWLAMIGEKYHIANLTTYMEKIRDERMRLHEYSPVFKSHLDTFEELEPNNTTPVDKFIDRKLVVNMLSNLKDDPELENKLLLEWGSDAYVSNDRSYKIRTSRNINDLKVKLTTPWSNTEINHRNESLKKPTIKVENLKEALNGQPQYISQNNTLQSLTNQCISKRPNGTVSDINLLLQSLSLVGDASNSTSLIHPPYK